MADSITSRVIEERLEDHVHMPAKVYPTLAAGVTVTGGAAWTLGAFVQIVPASTITSPFDIHGINIESASANTTYEIVLYYGASDIECGRIRFSKTAAQDAPNHRPFQTPVIPANSRIQAKIASAAGGADTAVVSLYYHTY